MPAPALPKIDAPAVAPVGLADGLAETVFGIGNGNQMNMIGHQAIGPNRDVEFSAPLGHEFHVCKVVVLAEESLLTAIASLGNVMRHPRNNNASKSGHAPKILEETVIVKN